MPARTGPALGPLLSRITFERSTYQLAETPLKTLERSRNSRNVGWYIAKSECRDVPSRGQTRTRLPGLGTGSGFQSRAFIKPKIPVPAPMPTARDSKAITVNAGVRHSA